MAVHIQTDMHTNRPTETPGFPEPKTIIHLVNKMTKCKNKNAKALQLHSVILLCPISFDIFCTEIMFRITNHTHIRDQQVKTYEKRCFVFKFTSFEFLTVLLTAVLTGR